MKGEKGPPPPPLNRSEKEGTPVPAALTRIVIDILFNGNISFMKSTSVYSTVHVLNYLITASYACIITYKAL